MESMQRPTTLDQSNVHRRRVQGCGLNGVRDKVSDENRNGTDAQSSTNVPRRSQGLNLAAIFDETELLNIYLIMAVRFASILGWTGGVLYATYHVFLACEEHLDIWYKDPIMNPGILSGWLKRGRDSTDMEWEMFCIAFTSQLWFWYGLYVLMSRVVRPTFPQNWSYISMTLSMLMFWKVMGFLPAVFLFLQPVIYWVIAQTRSRLLVWTTTVFFIYNLNNPFLVAFLPDNSVSEFFFVITAAWTYARCVSFCYDVWEFSDNNSNCEIGLKYLGRSIYYCHYLPLSLSGPLVTYKSFEEKVILSTTENEETQRNLMNDDFNKFIIKIVRMALNVLLIELVLHLLYFRSLSMTTSVHPHLSLWAVCGTVYWLGQFFSMKYKVLYGIPTAIAELDGMVMPPLPKCPSYLHRYSVLWRDFDRGLYRFLVNYIYQPTLRGVQSLDSGNKIPLDAKKLFASFMSFVYVYIWHSLSFDVFVWTALNFLGITIERIGSVIKREIDKRREIRPIDWDFIVEPVVTVPLAGMSILNSSIFCGSMTAAASFASQIYQRWGDNYILLFLYFFTHTAVTLRTWNDKLYRLCMQIIKYY